jgi:hypothetical protein
MANKIELAMMPPAALIEIIEQLWKEIDYLKEEVRNYLMVVVKKHCGYIFWLFYR